MLKILSCKIFIIFYMSCSAYASTTKPTLKYEFWKDEAGIKVQACLLNHSSEKTLWLLPRFVEQNKHNKSFEIITDTKSYIEPNYDYIDTHSKSGSTCITYTLEEYKGWYNEIYQDVSKETVFNSW